MERYKKKSVEGVASRMIRSASMLSVVLPVQTGIRCVRIRRIPSFAGIRQCTGNQKLLISVQRKTEGITDRNETKLPGPSRLLQEKILIAFRERPPSRPWYELSGWYYSCFLRIRQRLVRDMPRRSAAFERL